MKKIITITAKIIWAIIGLAILAWTIYWYYIIHIIGNLGGILAGTILLASGIYLLMFFMLITILFILIGFINKFITKKRKKS